MSATATRSQSCRTAIRCRTGGPAERKIASRKSWPALRHKGDTLLSHRRLLWGGLTPRLSLWDMAAVSLTDSFCANRRTFVSETSRLQELDQVGFGQERDFHLPRLRQLRVARLFADDQSGCLARDRVHDFRPLRLQR